MSVSRDTDLATPAGALASYLDDLLHTATDAASKEVPESVPESEPEPAPVPEPVPARRPEPAVSAERPVAPPIRPVPVRQPETESTRSPVPEPAIDTPPAEQRQTPHVPVGGEPVGRPEWSDRPFECLIFRVAGLQLAVPLILLGAIHRLDEGVKPIPGSPRWYMGMLPEKERNLRVVDSAEWIMAGRVPENARENYRFVIRLDNSEWALACDDVAQSFTLNPDDVRWRTSRSKRPWLAGTVVKQMCALIDVGAMAQLLARAEKEHHLNIE
ncbi:CheW domain-containing protein [Marinobacter zhejiangensis]|nr:CheW domain-containing protein [Marinobacter zhejiangensis]